ncbi:MAG: FAD-dependent oxidoreductase [Elusimicrobia bacterium]|nr:FAD-dependent oxidoreductase [Elusimicrobiota bacterium]
MAKQGVVIVGGGVVGVSAAYWLSKNRIPVTLLDQYEVPNRWSASGDHLQLFGLTHGKDAFYSEMAAKALTFWRELNKESGAEVFCSHGMLDLAETEHGYEEDSLRVLKDMRVPAQRLEKKHIAKLYPMINTRAVRWGLFHKDGGIIWAFRAVQALASLAQKQGAKVRPHVRITQIVKDKNGIRCLRDAAGHSWEGERFLFAGGCWTPNLLSQWRLPVRVTRQAQIYVRPLLNSGRYRPQHFPVFSVKGAGFYGFPLHIHGFLKFVDDRRGPLEKKPDPSAAKDAGTAFEKKCRKFLGRFIPELERFTESESSIGYYVSGKDGDFVVDRLPGAPNAFVACGFSGKGFGLGPVIGGALADLAQDRKPEINLHRFRISRFKR